MSRFLSNSPTWALRLVPNGFRINSKVKNKLRTPRKARTKLYYDLGENNFDKVETLGAV